MFFVDGFNLFHSLDSTNLYGNKTYFHRYKWLNLVKLAQSLLTKDKVLKRVRYYTTIAKWKSQASQIRHKNYIKALENTDLVDVSYGLFRKKTKHCFRFDKSYCLQANCDGILPNIQEKRIDVKIAVDLIKYAYADEFDTAIILSGDSDYIPSIEYVMSVFSNKLIGIAVPPGRKAQELENTVNFSIKIKEHHLKTCQFENTVKLNNGYILYCPPQWK